MAEYLPLMLFLLVCLVLLFGYPVLSLLVAPHWRLPGWEPIPAISMMPSCKLCRTGCTVS
jgi:hypothetical protein